WQERPVIILLHGWGDSASYKLRFPLIARRCNRAGYNVATLVAPYHFQRRPRRRGTFESGDCLLLAERTAQGLAESRALMGWLLREGCPAVALGDFRWEPVMRGWRRAAMRGWPLSFWQAPPCALDPGWSNGPSDLVSAGGCRALASYARR